MENKKHYQSLIKPSASWNKDTLTDNYGECRIKPLEPSFGYTVANTLRRILLGGIEASGVSSVIIEGVNNEFSVINGVYDDTLTILLRLQQIIVKNETGLDGIISICTKKSGPLYAKDFICDNHLSIVNKDLLITTLSDDTDLNIKMFVTSGRGYIKTDWGEKKKLQEDGRIYLNVTYTPVLNVAFEVQKTRVGNDIGYDEILLKITTDGSISPCASVEYAISVIISQFQSLMNLNSIISFENKLVSDKSSDSSSLTNDKDEKAWKLPVLKDNFSPIFLLKSIDMLGLPARVHNCLISANIERIIDLVNLNANDIWTLKNFGKKSQVDLLRTMEDFGLSFEMNINEKQILKYMEEQNEASNKK